MILENSLFNVCPFPRLFINSAENITNNTMKIRQAQCCGFCHYHYYHYPKWSQSFVLKSKWEMWLPFKFSRSSASPQEISVVFFEGKYCKFCQRIIFIIIVVVFFLLLVSFTSEEDECGYCRERKRKGFWEFYISKHVNMCMYICLCAGTVYLLCGLLTQNFVLPLLRMISWK